MDSHTKVCMQLEKSVNMALWTFILIKNLILSYLYHHRHIVTLYYVLYAYAYLLYIYLL